MAKNKQEKQENKPVPKAVKQNISEEMRKSYLDYAMSVIVARALPDVRDGLKPVHRRIFYAMHELGLSHSAKFKKCANIVGEVLGKYHPHGDTSVYDSLVRMAQDFSLRYPMIDGQGNFGSIDGDSAAAYRYTEARMSSIAEEMLKDIEKNTVDFTPNYDGTKTEPRVLPAGVPQLLLNGTLGIAVGMATNIPPHNLKELVDATIHLIDKPKSAIEDLLQYVQGPDFPTGGIIFNKQDLKQAYATGKGGVVTRGEATITENKKGHYQIIISSIPFQVSKADLIAHIAKLVTDKKIDGIRDIRDESDKEGLQIAIELKNDAFPQKVLNNLYKHSDLEKTFHFNMLALIDGIQPQILSLKDILEHFIEHRRIIVERRTKFELNKAEDRAHILEGLKIAIDHIDAVIKTIKSSPDKEQAHERLMKKFKLTEKQATAILEMRLQTLAGLERQKIEDELKEKKRLIRDLKALLKDPKKILALIKEELKNIKQKYGDERRTKVAAHAVKTISVEDLIPEQEGIMILTKGGYVKRVNPASYKAQKRGGKGIIGVQTKEEDVVDAFIAAGTHDELLFFTDSGKVYKTKMYEIPEGTRISKGKSIVNFLSLGPKESVTSVLPIPKKKKGEKFFLVMVTKNGIIKKVEGTHFEDVRRSGIIAIKLKKGDVLRWAKVAEKGDHLILATKNAASIRFKESDIRAMGRSAAGVKAMRLKKGDELINADIVAAKEKDASLLVISEAGLGKKTKISNYRVQNRGGSGIKTASITSKTGPLVYAKVITAEMEEVIAISKKGQVIRTQISEIPSLGRATQGVRIMRLSEKDKVASLTCL